MALNSNRPESSGHKKASPAWRVIRSILLDLLLTGVVLCVFALFHHVIPRWGSTQAAKPVATAVVESAEPVSATPATSPEPTAEPSPDVTAEPSPEPTPEITPEPTPEPTPDPRTEWQIKFADHFTDDVVQTENSYTSPDVSVTVTQYTATMDDYPQVWYVADIYIGSIDNLQTYVSYDQWGNYLALNPLNMDSAANAIVAVNGDYYTVQYKDGFLVRNGETLYDSANDCDICVLYRDGTMESYGPADYDVDEVTAKDPWQSWRFGPALLDENGQPLETFNTEWGISIANPRTGIGYYEPGHYCLVVVDGRQQDYAHGLTMDEFAQLFADLGCKCAYNLDGGASSVMTFNDTVVNSQSAARQLGDIVFIAEPVTETAEDEALADAEGGN